MFFDQLVSRILLGVETKTLVGIGRFILTPTLPLLGIVGKGGWKNCCAFHTIMQPAEIPDSPLPVPPRLAPDRCFVRWKPWRGYHWPRPKLPELGWRYIRKSTQPANPSAKMPEVPRHKSRAAYIHPVTCSRLPPPGQRRAAYWTWPCRTNFAHALESPSVCGPLASGSCRRQAKSCRYRPRSCLLPASPSRKGSCIFRPDAGCGARIHCV